MGFEYYYIVIAVVVLKVLIWACVLYFRAERLKRARAQRQFIVVDSHTGHSSANPPQNRSHNDRSAILHFEEAPATSLGPPCYDQSATSQGPPSYDQAVSNSLDKPPPYSQVVNGESELPEARTPIPPHFTPPPQMSSSQRELIQ